MNDKYEDIYKTITNDISNISLININKSKKYYQYFFIIFIVKRLLYAISFVTK